MTAIYDLPKPTPADAERSKTLSNLIKQEMRAGSGAIPFTRFMELALYHPTLGYYNSETFTLGRAGDFTTAPEISPVFAKTIAHCFQSVLTTLNNGDILEFGAGTGRFAGEALIALEKLNNHLAHYYIVEPSQGLRAQQELLIAKNYPQYLKRITWLDTLPSHFTGVIFANEVLDALPFNRFKVDANGIAERYVTCINDQFEWLDQSKVSDDVSRELAAIAEVSSLSSNYQSEINLNIANFIKKAAACLSQGMLLFFDYGYGRPEYYRPERTKGTMTCFYRHHLHEDPLVLLGLQDITAHVNFTYVAEKSIENGLMLGGFTTQAGFLIENGLADILKEMEAKLDTIGVINLRQAVKTLTMPSEMGEVIKVMALEKGLNDAIPGFTLQDRRRDL